MTKKRTWRKSLHRTETWKGKRVKVTRNNKGRFVTWHKIRPYRRGVTAKGKWKVGAARRGFGAIKFGGKNVAAYGTVHGESKRVQMHGSGTQLYRAMLIISKHPPKKRFLTLSAEALLDDPDRYLKRGHWDARPEITS
jgi:hypothetical protein